MTMTKTMSSKENLKSQPGSKNEKRRRLKNRNLLVYLLVMLLEQWEDDLMENKALKRKKEHGEKDLLIDIEEKRCKLRKTTHLCENQIGTIVLNWGHAPEKGIFGIKNTKGSNPFRIFIKSLLFVPR